MRFCVIFLCVLGRLPLCLLMCLSDIERSSRNDLISRFGDLAAASQRSPNASAGAELSSEKSNAAVMIDQVKGQAVLQLQAVHAQVCIR